MWVLHVRALPDHPQQLILLQVCRNVVLYSNFAILVRLNIGFALELRILSRLFADLNLILDLLQHILEVVVRVVDAEDALDDSLSVLKRVHHLCLVVLCGHHLLLVGVDHKSAQIFRIFTDKMNVGRIPLADFGEALQALEGYVVLEAVDLVEDLALVLRQCEVAVESLELCEQCDDEAF